MECLVGADLLPATLCGTLNGAVRDRFSALHMPSPEQLRCSTASQAISIVRDRFYGAVRDRFSELLAEPDVSMPGLVAELDALLQVCFSIEGLEPVTSEIHVRHGARSLPVAELDALLQVGC